MVVNKDSHLEDHIILGLIIKKKEKKKGDRLSRHETIPSIYLKISYSGFLIKNIHRRTFI